MIETVLVLPSPPALLPPGSLVDPVADLRAACTEAVARLGDEGRPHDRLLVLAAPAADDDVARGVVEPLGHRVARHLLGDVTFETGLAVPGVAASILEEPAPRTLVVMADGSACRGEKAPGHLHPGAVAFDDAIERALRSGDAASLAALDADLGAEVWCRGVPALRVLGEVARRRTVTADLSYADAPHGVAWWVVRWDLSIP